MDDEGRAEDRSATRARSWVAGLLRGLSIVSLVAAVVLLAFALDPFYGLEDRRIVVQRDLVARLALSFGALALAVASGVTARLVYRRP